MNSFSRWLLIAVASVALVTPARAEDLKIETKLIWGTNDEKSPNTNHRPVDAALAKELRKVFKWTNYFEVSRQTGMVPSRGTKPFKISDECVVEITELEGPKVEVKLIGKGKAVNKTVKALSRGQFFTLGGEGKNGSAWFVIITQLEEKSAAQEPKAAPAAASGAESEATNTTPAK